MTIDISKFVQVPVLKWIGGASYARSEDTLFGRYEVERLASDSEWFLSCGRWEGGVHPSLDAAKAAAQADYAARKLAGLTPTPALVALINERHKLRAELSDLLTDADSVKGPHPAITHCDNCGCDWLDNGLNPVGCPYCKQPDEHVRKGDPDTIRELIRQRDEMAKALEPFAAVAEHDIGDDETDSDIFIPISKRNARAKPITVGDMRKARAAITSAPQCCVCGKTGLSTVEGDGGGECQLSDGRWTCSFECWERATESASPSHS